VLLSRNELAERLADELLQGGDRLRDFRERAFGITLAKAQGGERLKGLRTCIGNGGSEGPAVGRAVGMAEAELR
jgi:hypothetical protein